MSKLSPKMIEVLRRIDAGEVLVGWMYGTNGLAFYLLPVGATPTADSACWRPITSTIYALIDRGELVINEGRKKADPDYVRPVVELNDAEATPAACTVDLTVVNNAR